MVNISSVAGRFARNGNGVYALTKFGVGAFSESLRQELAGQYVRVSLVEPGATDVQLWLDAQLRVRSVERSLVANRLTQFDNQADVYRALGLGIESERLNCGAS